jgi:ABC-type multidrug transport system fused ATPase/permease subunit
VHRRLRDLCEEFETLCYDAAQTAVTHDSADRWLQTRIYAMNMFMLAVLAFTLLQDDSITDSVLGSGINVVPAAVALLQLALLPEPAELAVSHGASLCEGLAALKRMRSVWKHCVSEELESPLIHMRLPSARERRDMEEGYASLRSRVVLGDKVIERGGEAEQALRLYDLAVLEKKQNVSCLGFALEQVADDWPYFGAIEMKDVTMRYYRGATPALQDVRLQLPTRSSLLLVGAQDSGKTSLIRTLLRLWPCESGSLILDCVDVRCVGVSALRSRVAYVPQATILFSGTWRTNLDPLEEYEERQLVLVLRLTRLWHWLWQHAPKRLDEPLPETLNPAVKALLGLSRALLRLLQKRSKLLIMDCTTCMLDAESDADLTALMLRYCRRQEAAVLQASRRVLQSPLYDAVAVIRAGRVVEQGVPRKLWGKDGAFRELARSQGVDSAKLSRPEAVAQRLTSTWNWDVSPQEDPDWADEFAVSMKKPKGGKLV